MFVDTTSTIYDPNESAKQLNEQTSIIYQIISSCIQKTLTISLFKEHISQLYVDVEIRSSEDSSKDHIPFFAYL